MKFDMSGAASVLGTVRALAAMKAPVNVIAVAPACENMPGGHASKPGDVVTTLSGQTVEILNHRRRGPADPLRRADLCERFKPEVLVDIATLTGACVVALGHVASGLFANDQKLADEIRDAADDAWTASGRCRCWRTTRSSCAPISPTWRTSAPSRGQHYRSVLSCAVHAQAALGAHRYRRDGLEERTREGLDRTAGFRSWCDSYCGTPKEVTSIDFYFNAEDRLQVACRLAGKALARASAC